MRSRFSVLRLERSLRNGLWLVLLAMSFAVLADDGPRPPAVVVAAVETKIVDESRRFVGTVKAIQSVDIRARVEGFLEEVAFKEGGMVDKGAVLYRIEQAQYQAALDSAKGQVAAAKADSDSAKAQMEDMQADFERQESLVKKGDTSKTAFDRSKAKRDEAKADVEKAAASEQQAEAERSTAEINLGYTTLSSPIKGRIGATGFTVGNLVGPASGTLATVVQLDPIRAVFSIPSGLFVEGAQRMGEVDRESVLKQFVPTLILPTGEPYGHKGTIAFADNQVDATTGTVAIYADFPNPGHVLLPGQYVNAEVHKASQSRLPVVPGAALQRTKEGQQVWVVGTDNRVSKRAVKTGARVGTDYAVTSGLQEGELVVVSGVQKVTDGMVVAPTRTGAHAQSAPAAAKGSGGDL